MFNILTLAKSVFLRGGTDSRAETIARTASARSYRRLARRVDPATTLGEISELAATAGLNPAALTLAAIRNLKVAS